MWQLEDDRCHPTHPSSRPAGQEGALCPAIHLYLITQTLADFGKLTPDVRVRAIHGENSDRVIADITEHAKRASLDGEVLFITHSALMLLPYIHRRHDWHVIVDEIPPADWCGEFNIPHTHRLITDCFTVDAEASNLADNRYERGCRRIAGR